MMPEDGLDQLREYDAIFLGANAGAQSGGAQCLYWMVVVLLARSYKISRIEGLLISVVRT